MHKIRSKAERILWTLASIFWVFVASPLLMIFVGDRAHVFPLPLNIILGIVLGMAILFLIPGMILGVYLIYSWILEGE